MIEMTKFKNQPMKSASRMLEGVCSSNVCASYGSGQILYNELWRELMCLILDRIQAFLIDVFALSNNSLPFSLKLYTMINIQTWDSVIMTFIELLQNSGKIWWYQMHVNFGPVNTWSLHAFSLIGQLSALLKWFHIHLAT